MKSRSLRFKTLISFFTVMLTCSLAFGQTNTTPVNQNDYHINQNTNPGNQTTVDPATSISNPVNHTNTQGQSGTSGQLTQQEKDQINETIAELQIQLGAINDPNHPKAVKITEKITHLQNLLIN